MWTRWPGNGSVAVRSSARSRVAGRGSCQASAARGGSTAAGREVEGLIVTLADRLPATVPPEGRFLPTSPPCSGSAEAAPKSASSSERVEGPGWVALPHDHPAKGHPIVRSIADPTTFGGSPFVKESHFHRISGSEHGLPKVVVESFGWVCRSS